MHKNQVGFLFKSDSNSELELGSRLAVILHFNKLSDADFGTWTTSLEWKVIKDRKEVLLLLQCYPPLLIWKPKIVVFPCCMVTTSKKGNNIDS